MSSLRQQIKNLEAQGYTGKTNPKLDRLNRIQTDKISDRDLPDKIHQRLEAGEPAGKLIAAARDRNVKW